MEKITELYLALLTTGKRVVFSIEDDYNGSQGIGEKKEESFANLTKNWVLTW